MASLKTSVPTGHSLSAPHIEPPARRFYVAFVANAEGGGFVYRWASVSAQTPGGALRIARVSHPECAGFHIIGSPASLPPSAHMARSGGEIEAMGPALRAVPGPRRRASDFSMACC